MPAPALSFEAYSAGHPLRDQITVIDRLQKRTNIDALVTTITQTNDEGKIASPITECRSDIAYAKLVRDEAATIVVEGVDYKARDVLEQPQSDSVSFYLERV